MVDVSHVGPVWVVKMAHTEAESVEGSLAAIAGGLAFVPGAQFIAGAIGAAAGYIQLVDAIGGDRGVEITGVYPSTGFIVTPQAQGIFESLTQTGREAVATETVLDYILGAASASPGVATTLGIGAAAGVFGALALGTPLGWALAGAAGAVVKLLEPAPDPNQHGGIHADRTAVGPWEKFIMAKLPKTGEVSILAWQGLFSAQGGGGGSVFANRAKVDAWETWTLIQNPDGSVSFRTVNGHFLTATAAGGPNSYCLADRAAIGDWEKFRIEHLPGGHIAIKTQGRGTYLSVQSGV